MYWYNSSRRNGLVICVVMVWVLFGVMHNTRAAVVHMKPGGLLERGFGGWLKMTAAAVIREDPEPGEVPVEGDDKGFGGGGQGGGGGGVGGGRRPPRGGNGGKDGKGPKVEEGVVFAEETTGPSGGDGGGSEAVIGGGGNGGTGDGGGGPGTDGGGGGGATGGGGEPPPPPGGGGQEVQGDTNSGNPNPSNNQGQDNNDNGSGSALSVGAIAGIAAGGAVLLLVVVAGVGLLIRSRRNSSADEGDLGRGGKDVGGGGDERRKKKRTRKGGYVDFKEVDSGNIGGIGHVEKKSGGVADGGVGRGAGTGEDDVEKGAREDRERETVRLGLSSMDDAEKGAFLVEPLSNNSNVVGDRYADIPSAPNSSKFGWMDSRVSASSDDTIVAPPLAVDDKSDGTANPTMNKSGSKIAPWFVDLRNK